VKDRLVHLRLSHRDQSIVFDGGLFPSAVEATDGPAVPSLTSATMRQQLTSLSARLTNVAAMLSPAQRAADRAARRQKVIENMANKVRASSFFI
jgi:hypothetical protein